LGLELPVELPLDLPLASVTGKFGSVEISISDMAIVKQVEQGQSVLYLLSAPLLVHSQAVFTPSHRLIRSYGKIDTAKVIQAFHWQSKAFLKLNLNSFAAFI
jgi:hypothetical protein